MVLHSKLRSWLTIVGIVIGVASVIAIVSLGQGLQQTLNSQLSGLGGDILTLSAGSQRGGGFGGFGGPGGSSGGAAKATTKTAVLTRTDIQTLRGLSDVLYADNEIRGTVNVSYLDKSGQVSVTGVDPKVWSHVTTVTVSAGRLLDPTDQNTIVIGGRLASGYFSQPVGVNNVLTIEGRAFRVVGIISDQSTSIYMPITFAYQVLPTKIQNQFDSIVIKIRNQDVLNESLTNIQNKLIVTRHVTATTMDFSLTSNQQLQQTRAATLSSMTAFLLAIAGVSLIVGAIGVANTMFTSVLEKTKEIGIMKAIGARNQDILLIFLFNAALIGLVGGILGIIVGGAFSGLLPSLLGGTPFSRDTAIVSMSSVIIALSVSVGVGIIAGSIPAYQASKLKPVDALRYD